MCEAAMVNDLPAIVKKMRSPDVDSKYNPVSMAIMVFYNIATTKGRQRRDIVAAVESGQYNCYAWFNYKADINKIRKMFGVLYNNDTIEYFEGEWVFRAF